MPDVLDIPLLTGPTLTLRPHTAADVDAVLERCRHPDTIRWTTVPDPYTREMAQEYLAGLGPSAEQVSWAIERGGAYAGTITCDPGGATPTTDRAISASSPTSTSGVAG